jgi:hypothetical protein
MSDLLKINVNEHTEKKNNLTYLSWAWAWSEVLKIDPIAEWVPLYFGPETNQTPYLQLPDGSMMVGISVCLKGTVRQCMLPVMNHRNQAIKNPDSFAVNTAMMRCLAKAIAMHGLGLYIYAGEDLPESDGKTDDKKDGKTPTDQMGMDGFDADSERAAELRELALFLIDAYATGNEIDAIRMFYDEATWDKDNAEANEEKKYVWGLLRSESKLRSMLKANSPHAKKN